MSESKEVTKKVDAPSALTKGAEAIEGMGEVLPHQIEIPLLVVVQGTSRDIGDAKPGDWFLRSTGRSYGARINVVPITWFTTRGYFVKDQPGPMCISLDGKVPLDGESPTAPNGRVYRACSGCYFSTRQPDPKNPRSKLPAPCAEQINLLALVMAPDEKEAAAQLCRIRLKRTSYKCGSQIISNALMNAPRYGKVWGQVYQLTNVIEQGEIGKYAVPHQMAIGDADKLYPKIDAIARDRWNAWKAVKDHYVNESVAPDDSVEAEPAADAEPAPAAASAQPGKPPPDDLPFDFGR